MADFTNLATYARSLGWNPNLQPGRAKPATRTIPPVAPPPSAAKTIAKNTTDLPALTRSAVPVDLNAEATKMVDARVQPLLDEIRSRIGAQAASGTQAIRGYTGELVSQLEQQAATAGQPYRDAQVSQAASDSALAQRLTGQGSDLAQALAAKLQAAGDPGGLSASLPAAAAQTGMGSGNALYARGSASLADLIAREAAAKDYAGKQPGIARLSGLQQTGQLEGQLSTQLATQTGELMAKVPGLVQDAYSGLVSAQSKQDAITAANQRAQAQIDATNAREAARLESGNWRTKVTTQAANARALLAANLAVDKANQAAKLSDRDYQEKVREFNKGEATKVEVAKAKARAEVAKANAKARVEEAKAKAKALTPSVAMTKLHNDGKLYNAANEVIGSGIPITTKGGGGGTGASALPSPTITRDMHARGYTGLWGGTRSNPVQIIGADGKPAPVPKGYLTTPSGTSSTAGVQKLDTLLKEASSTVTSLYDDNYGNPRLSKEEARRQALIIASGVWPTKTPAEIAKIVDGRVNRWYANQKPAATATAPASAAEPAVTETYKVGHTGIFVYTDPNEAVGNNTPGVHPVRHIKPGDPDWADAVAKAIDPKTMKPLNPTQKQKLLEAGGVGPKAPGR